MKLKHVPVLILLPIVGGAACPPPPPVEGNSAPSQAIYFGPRGAPLGTTYSQLMTRGESKSIPVTIQSDLPSTDDQTFDIGVKPIAGVALKLTPETVTIMPGERFADAVLEITTDGASPIGNHTLQLTAREGDHPQMESNPVNLEIVNKLVSVEVDPATENIPRGGFNDFVLKFLPRGNTSGNVNVSIGNVFPNGVTVTPNVFAISVAAGATTPVQQTVRASADASAPLGDGFFNVLSSSRVIGTGRFVIVEPTAQPGFTLTSSHASVTSVLNTPSEEVTFTIASVGGWSGEVEVYYEPLEVVAVFPEDNNFKVNVAPGSPYMFKRRFTWFRPDIHDPQDFIYWATDTSGVLTDERSVKVIVNRG